MPTSKRAELPCQLNRGLQPFQYLQGEPSREKTRDERIFDTYAEMYDAWFEDREQIPAGRLAEIAFVDLERDPVGTLQTIYSALGLPGFDTMAPRIHAAVDALSGYKKNTYPPLSAADRARVVSRWGRSFTAWGYAH